MPIESRPDQRSRQRRDQVLTAAAARFQDRGFHGASMSEIAVASGMSVGHIYHYFQNKEAIIEAIVERNLLVALGFMDRMAHADNLEQALLAHHGSGEGR